MSDGIQPDPRNCLLVAAYGLTTDQVLALPAGAAERMSLGRIARCKFKNAAKDFITIVATSERIAAGEEHLRLKLIIAVQTIPAREWDTAATGSESEFESLRRGEKPWVFHLLSLILATRRSSSQTDEGRWDMLHGISFPTRYSDNRHQELFEFVVQLARDEL